MRYDLLARQLEALMEGERDLVANLANASALLRGAFENINWVGFYLMKQGMLVLGPFQGKPACIRIPVGRGVCGTAAAGKRTVVVPDVHAFPGHIACDEASRSEVAVPILLNDTAVGVLDIDSPLPGRFTDADARGLEPLCKALAEGCDW